MAQPTIVVTDNANGTGCQVTVSNTDPTSINTVGVALTDRFNQLGYTYLAGVGRVGDGPIQVPLDTPDNPGPPVGVNLTHAWYVVVINNLSLLTSAPAIVTPTYGLVSPHFQAMCALQRFLIGLNLGRIKGTVYRCEDPNPFFNNVQNWPAILLSPPDPTQRASQSNLLDLWTFPIQAMVADNDPTWYAQTEWHLWSVWTIYGSCDRKSLDFGNGQPGRIRRMSVQPKSGINPSDDKYQFQTSLFTINCECDRWVGFPGNN
jgi:hypothetical protein